MIASFQIDHTKLKPGIYIQGEIQNTVTYDIRLFEPAKLVDCVPDWLVKLDIGKPTTLQANVAAAFHTLEHVLAMYFRVVCDYKDSVVYIGPAGCLTCFYLVVTKSYVDWVSEIKDAFKWTERYLNVNDHAPGATPIECGNSEFHNIVLAHEIASRFLEMESEWWYKYPVKSI